MTVHQFPKRPQKGQKNNKPQRPQPEKMLNVEDPAPFVLGFLLVLCFVGLQMAPTSFKDFVFQACVLAAQDGQVLLGGRPLGSLSSLLTHGLIHTGWVDVLMSSAFIIIFGIITIRGVAMKNHPVFGIRRGAAVFLAIFLAGIVAGGLAQWAYWIIFGASGVMVGTSSAVSSLFAATAFAMGGRQYLMSFGVLVIGMQVFGLVMGGAPTWPSELCGYLVGALLAMRWIIPNSASMGRFG